MNDRERLELGSIEANRSPAPSGLFVAPGTHAASIETVTASAANRKGWRKRSRPNDAALALYALLRARHAQSDQVLLILQLNICVDFNINVDKLGGKSATARMLMKYNEFKRWLKDKGVEFAPGKGSHQKLRLHGKTSVFPDHGSKEMPEPLRKKIMKDLGL